MSTNMTEFRWFSKIIESLRLDESCLSIGRVKDDAFQYYLPSDALFHFNPRSLLVIANGEKGIHCFAAFVW